MSDIALLRRAWIGLQKFGPVTARCSDGGRLFSHHAQGTCSHHGGVARWGSS